MYIPISWLKEYINISTPIDQIASLLTKAGIEVDSLQKNPLAFTKVVVAKILDTKPHPKVNNLTVATVFNGTANLQVVCGAHNCHKNMVVALAPIGATLMDEKGHLFSIKKESIHDVESHGTLCSGKELGLTDKADGILDLNGLSIGKDLSELLKETIMEVSLTPNLGHCMSIIGIARELSAILEIPMLSSDNKQKKEAPQLLPLKLGKISEDCMRYSAKLLTNVMVKPSPFWLQYRLILAGMTPVNCIVDATNYVMHELGQPLHAFDYDKLGASPTISVSRPKDSIEFTTLDDKKRSVNTETLLIYSNNESVAIAGIMGGKNTEISDTTTSILLESACFAPSRIRKGCKNLNLTTQASKRFERGTDPNITSLALDMAANLICKITSAEIASPNIDYKAHEFSNKLISCRVNQISRSLGIELSLSEVESLLKRLNLVSSFDGENLFTVSVPTYRHDIQYEIDIIEEIARMYGYDNIMKTETYFSPSSLRHAPLYTLEQYVRNHLLQLGLQEFITCDLISPRNLEELQEMPINPSTAITVLNPNSIDHSLLRSSLLYGLLQVVKHNGDFQSSDIHGFEIGKIHFKEENTFTERVMASLILKGHIAPNSWEEEPKSYNFFDIKGMIEMLLQALGINPDRLEYKNLGSYNFHPGRQANVIYKEHNLGLFGQLHPRMLRKLGIQQPVFFAEIDLSTLDLIKNLSSRYTHLATYPGTTRDWTLTCLDTLPVGDLLHAIRSLQSTLLKEVELISIYRSEKLGGDKKNVTVRLLYRDDSQTIAYDTAEKEHQAVTLNVANQFSNYIRQN